MGAVLLRKGIIEYLPIRHSWPQVQICSVSRIGHSGFVTRSSAWTVRGSLGNVKYAPLLLLHETLYLQKVFNCLCNIHMGICVMLWHGLFME